MRRVPNIGFQRTAHCRRAAAEAGSFGPAVVRFVAIGLVLVTVSGSRAGGQVPSWAEGREFQLKDVEMAISRPSGGWRAMSPDGKVVDDSAYFQGFTVTVYGDGRVIRADDTDNGPVTRTIERNLSSEIIYTLLDRFVRARFFELPAEYNGGAAIGPWLPRIFKVPPAYFHIIKAHNLMDATYLKLRLKIADHEKLVTDWNSEGPKELDGIAAAIEEVGGIRKHAN